MLFRSENPVNRDADGAEQPTESDTNEADGRARNVHEPPPKNMEGGDDVCGSLEDWLHPLPTFEDSEVSHIAFLLCNSLLFLHLFLFCLMENMKTFVANVFWFLCIPAAPTHACYIQQAQRYPCCRT